MIRLKRINYLLIFTAILLASCFREDEVVVPQKPGNLETVVIEMLPDYTIQTWFSFEHGIVSSCNRDSWDLAIATREGDYTLWLNTSLFMYAAHSGITEFSVPLQTAGMEWKFDASDGSEAGNAIGKWWTADTSGFRGNGEVLLIDRGIDSEGFSRGFLKIQPHIDPLSGEVSIRIARPDGTNERVFDFPRDPVRRFSTLSFDNGAPDPQTEPPAGRWDLLFTTYTTLLFTNTGEPYPYLVNGVLLNDTLVMAALDTLKPFTEIDRDYAETVWLSSSRDMIGYEWKKINGDVTSGDITYTAQSGWTYLVRNREGLFFKMRFIDFYNNQGKKGYPTFEFQRL